MNRDMTWHELYEHIKDNQCPICALLLEFTDRAMDSFLYESVNDPSLREKIMQSHGLCNFHSRMLLKKGDPLAHALIYIDLLNQTLTEIKSLNMNALSVYGKHSDCIFCKNEKSSEKLYAVGFLAAYQDKEFAKKYEDDGMLCVSHTKLIIESSSKSQANIINNIINTTEQKYKSLLNDLYEIKRKNDYRFNNEPWTESERTAWKKAVAVINGFDILIK